MFNQSNKLKSKFNRHSHMYDTANVVAGFEYWFDKLLAYCLNMFKYDNLPSYLPRREIEANLILTGHCVCFRYENEILTTRTELYGFDKYYNPTSAVYAQPRLKSHNLTLNSDDVVIIYNCDLESQILGQDVDGSLSTFISRYARQLADIESTIAIKLVNMRSPNMPATIDDKVRQSVLDFFKKIELGQRTVVTDNNVIPLLRNIELDNHHDTTTINDLLIARDKIFECFMREVGVRFYQTKKAQVNAEEVNANEYLYLISIDDMLESRMQGVEMLNKKFGMNVSVRVNEKWGAYYDSDNSAILQQDKYVD